MGPVFDNSFFSSYFSFEVLKNCSNVNSDWSLFSEFAEKRQRHPLGNIELPFQIITHLESPNLAEYGTAEGFQEFIYLSQITQAEELRTETEVCLERVNVEWLICIVGYKCNL